MHLALMVFMLYESSKSLHVPPANPNRNHHSALSATHTILYILNDIIYSHARTSSLCSSDYQRISEHYKKQASKRPPPWPSHENRPIKTPPRRLHTSDSMGSLPPTPQHQHQQQQQSFLSASAGSGGLPLNPRDRLNTIDIRPQPRFPDGGYDTYDVNMM